MGLARGDYTLMPLWVWIYCIIWWFVQDILKVGTIAMLNKFDIFPNTPMDMALFDKGNDVVWFKTQM